jgi:hypothetical protein
LAEEEMAKALILSVCASGILAHRGWFKLAFEKHTDKHVAMSIVAIVARLKRLFRGTVPSRRPSSKRASGIALMKLLRKTSKLLRQHDFLAREFSALLEELRALAALQKIRERAFYVDLHSTPSADVSAREFHRLMRIARSHRDSVEWGSFVGREATASIDKLRAGMSEETLRSIRETEATLFDKGFLRKAVTFLESGESEALIQRIRSAVPLRKNAQDAKAIKGLRTLAHDISEQVRKTESRSDLDQGRP